MILAKKVGSQLLWSELTDTESESINGGISHSKSKSSHSRIVNISITQIFQTNIVTIIGNISGDVTIGQGNSSQGNRR